MLIFTKNNMLKSLLLMLTLSMFLACGYRPSTQLAKKVLGEKVYTVVDVSLVTPENSVLTKDALNKALETRLKTIVTKKEEADSMISVMYESANFIPLQYDKNGYVIQYQVQTRLRFTFTKGDHSEMRSFTGYYEFSVLPTAIIAYNAVIKALEESSVKALDQFIAYIAAKGYFVDEKK